MDEVDNCRIQFEQNTTMNSNVARGSYTNKTTIMKTRNKDEIDNSTPSKMNYSMNTLMTRANLTNKNRESAITKIRTKDEIDNSTPLRMDFENSNSDGNDIERKGTKRNFEEETEPIVKRLKKNGFGSSRTPLAILNELRTGLNYKVVLSDGPPHNPNFLASVEVDGIVFNGCGNAKKQAKQKAAEAALLTLCPNLFSPQCDNYNIDFTEDSPVTPVNKEAGFHIETDPTKIAIGQKKARVEMLVSKALSGALNAVMALNEILPGLKYECAQEQSQKSHAQFLYVVKINQESYQGSGSSKKSAKAAAARSVLLQRFGHLLQNTVMLAPPACQNVTPAVGSTFQPIAANKIAELVVSEYQKLMKGIQPEYARRKVLAAIVMTTNPECTNGKLISLATGTKCVSGDHISVKGAVLNDSHAEIISRRGLLRFIYNQLSLHSSPSTAEESIFIFDSEINCFKLKEDVRFHLYISTSPCGDARIFSPHDIEGTAEESLDRHPNRQSRGQLRTKIESGEGTIPVKSFDSIQTWDGVMQGERLLTMSCSDKLGKWNVVGLQGSLLSHFIEPIYLHSIIIGSLFHHFHLRRALYARIENVLEGLPPPYRLNKVLMNSTTSPETRQAGKAPNFSVNWVIGEENVEIINAITGKSINGNSSRLCKQMLFGKFYGLLNQGIKTRSDLSVQNVPEFYADIKSMSKDYKEAKNQMVAAFLKAGLGNWMKKPIEQDQFVLDPLLI